MDAIHHEHGRYHRVDCGEPMHGDNWPYPGHPHSGCDPRYGYKGPKFERHIFIRRDQIYFDLDSQIAIITKARRKDDGTENGVQDNATNTYKQQFDRWIDKYIGIAKTTMSAFVLESFQVTDMNFVKGAEEVDITLLVPAWYDDTVFTQLTNAVHDYVVNATLYEFFSIFLLNPGRYGASQDPATLVKQQQKDDALADIKKLINASKPGVIRKPYNPF